MKNFFISYTKTDRPWAEWLSWFFESRGYSTFVQFKDIAWSENFIVRMEDGLKEAERMVVILSPEFLESGFTAAEWSSVFAKDPDGRKRLLLPIRVKQCDLIGLFGPRVYLDLVGRDESTASSTLDGALRQLQITPYGAASSLPKPSFP